MGNIDGGHLSMLPTGPAGDHYWLGTDERSTRRPARSSTHHPRSDRANGPRSHSLKIDVEGFEYEVLQGAAEFLRTSTALAFPRAPHRDDPAPSASPERRIDVAQPVRLRPFRASDAAGRPRSVPASGDRTADLHAMSDAYAWHILTANIRPSPAGSAITARCWPAGLAEAGAEVHVWAVRSAGASRRPSLTGHPHRLRKGWSRAGLARARRGARCVPAAATAPRPVHAQRWGYKGLNLGFCRWLVGRRDGATTSDDVPRDPVLLASAGTARPAGARRVPALDGEDAPAGQLLVYLSTPYWERLLRIYEPGRGARSIWLPVPSNIPPSERSRKAWPIFGSGSRAAATTILGSFGTSRD